jgi:hypothetical protein
VKHAYYSLCFGDHRSFMTGYWLFVGALSLLVLWLFLKTDEDDDE